MLLDLVRQLRLACDPVELARVCGFILDPWQHEFLSSQSKRILLCCSRQAGKSTSTALLAVHQALYSPGSLTILLSPSQTQSMELYRKCQSFLEMVPDAPACKQSNLTRLELPNQSRIVSLPGNSVTVRGFSAVSLLIVDEAARVPDELITAARPMLAAAAHGRLIALSSPAGRRGFFFEAWNSDGWEKFTVTADQVPRISKEFLASELEAMGPMRYAEEYGCEFIDSEVQAFGSDLIAAAFTDDVRPLRDAA